MANLALTGRVPAKKHKRRLRLYDRRDPHQNRNDKQGSGLSAQGGFFSAFGVALEFVS